MSCECHIEATDASQKKVLFTLLGLNATMFVAELIIGSIITVLVLRGGIQILADARSENNDS